MGNIVLRLLQIVAPVFVAGYAFGWLETMQYVTPEVRNNPDTILSLWQAVLMQSVSLIGVVASLGAFWNGDESFIGGMMGFVSAMGIAVFYGFYSTPYVILALIGGFNFPYVFCLVTWAGPLLAMVSIKIVDDL